MSFWWQALPSAASLLLSEPAAVVGEVPAFQHDAFQDSFQGGSVSAPHYRRMMFDLLPPWKLWRRTEGSVLSKLLTACADELARLEVRVVNLLDEADPQTAVELLPEYERELGLVAAATVAERQAQIVSRLVARQRFRPVDFQTALAPLLGQDAADVDVIETSRADAVAMDDDREIYRFFVYRNPALPGTYYLDAAQALVDQIKPSHTVGHVIESINFLCDSATSLCDRDILGA